MDRSALVMVEILLIVSLGCIVYNSLDISNNHAVIIMIQDNNAQGSIKYEGEN